MKGLNGLIRGLRQAGIEFSAEDLVDALWLAPRLAPREDAAQSIREALQPQVDAERETLPESRQPELAPPSEEAPPDPAATQQDGTKAYLPAADNASGQKRRGVRVHLPDTAGLPHALAISRALRPLRRMQQSARSFVVDEFKTAERLAVSDIWLPLLVPDKERWLSAALIIDTGASMAVWQTVVREFRRLLESLGAFRNVTQWWLDTEDPTWTEEANCPAPLFASGRSPTYRHPLDVVHSCGRQLIFVVSDCVSDAWWGGRAARLVGLWGKTNHTVLLQILPQSLWLRTGLSQYREVLLNSRRAASPNADLVAMTKTFRGRVSAPATVAVPVLELEANALKAWARWVSHDAGGILAGRALDYRYPAEPIGSANEDDAWAQAPGQPFLTLASQTARKLANIMAVAPPFNLPLLRVIRESMLGGEASQVHEAEFLLGGLVKIAAGHELRFERPNEVLYDFQTDELRKLFRAAVKMPVALNVLRIEQVSRFLSRHLGQPNNFPAYLASPSDYEGAIDLGAATNHDPIAHFTRDILQWFGEPYVSLLQEIPVCPMTEDHTETVSSRCPAPGGAQDIYEEVISGSSQLDTGKQTNDDSIDFTAASSFEGHTGPVTALAILPDGRLVSGSYDRTIRLWDLVTGVETSRLKGHSGPITALAILPDGRLASSSNDNTIRLWDTTFGAETARLEGHSGPVTALTMLADGRLASSSNDNTIRFWDVTTSAETARLEGHTGPVIALAQLPDGRLASGSYDRTIRLWDLIAGHEAASFEGHKGTVTALAILPNGRLASSSNDNTIKIWDVVTGVETAQLEGHSSFVTALVPLTDGRLASASNDMSIRLWDFNTVSESTKLECEGVSALVMLSEDRIVSGSYNGSIRIWDVKTEAVSHVSASGSVHRAATVAERPDKTQESRIYISYSLKDGAAFAKELREWFLAEGFSVFQDIFSLEGGSDWWSQIETTLRSKSLQHMVLVVTPGILASKVIRQEIRLARQEGKTFLPIRGPGLPPFVELPRWLGHLFDIDIPEQCDTLLRVLKAQVHQPTRVPMMAPEPPANFVARPFEFQALKAKLLDAKGDAVAITVALKGAGGCGKTTLARALAHDPDIQDAFYDGTLWVELGEQPENVVSILSDLVEILTGDRPGVETVNGAATKLSEALGDRRILLVIDDIWREQDARPFLQGGRNTTRLITTRIDTVLPHGTEHLSVASMQTHEAFGLLAMGLPEEQATALHGELDKLAARLGKLALPLKLVNGFLRDHHRTGHQPLREIIADVNNRLDAMGLIPVQGSGETAHADEIERALADPIHEGIRENTAYLSEKRVALVIGNGRYTNAAALRNPANDAIAMSTALSRFGFQIIGGPNEGVDLDYSKFAARIRDFGRNLKDAKVALLYYSGHGLQIAGRNYLVPVDAELIQEADVYRELIELQTVLTLMEGTERTCIVILDVCRDNPLAHHIARALELETQPIKVAEGLAEQRVAGGTLIAFATQPGNVAYDGAGQNGLFTEALLEQLRLDAGRDVELLFREVRAKVIGSTKNKHKGPQVPWVHSSLTGRFSFVPPMLDATASADARLAETLRDWSTSSAERERINYSPEGARLELSDQDKYKNKQIKIRDFGEKVGYLVGVRGKPELSRDFGEPLPTAFPIFKSATAFAKKLRVDASALSLWKEDVARHCRYRLAPKITEVEEVARLFGIWPKTDEPDLLAFWKSTWPSWFSGEAQEQYKKEYVRPTGDPLRGKPAGDRKPDSLDAFQKAYCEALRQYQLDPASSLLYFPLEKDWRAVDKAARDLVKLVRMAPQVLIHLQTQLGMDGLLFKPSADWELSEANITSTVERLLKLDIDVVIDACQLAYSEVLSEHSGKQLEATVFTEFVQRLIPAIYDNFAVSRIKSAIGEDIGGLVELPVHHRTVVDILVAAAEKRPTSYLPRNDRDQWPVGTRSFIDQIPDSGFSSGDQLARDVRTQLASPIMAAKLDDVYEAIRAYVVGGPFSKLEPGANFTDEEKFELAGEIIKNKMKFEGRKFYMVFYLPKSKEDREALSVLIERLKKKLPGMLFLALDGDKSTAKAEIKRFQPFVWMLPVETA